MGAVDGDDGAPAPRVPDTPGWRAVCEAVRAWGLQPDSVCHSALEWWDGYGGSEHRLLKAPAQALLKIGSGTSDLERLFSKAQKILGDKQRKKVDAQRLLMANWESCRQLAAQASWTAGEDLDVRACHTHLD